MDRGTAAGLIANAVPPGAATWADLGAGTGTFTLAIADCLGPQGIVIAVDNDGRALAALKQSVSHSALGGRIHLLEGDFREPLTLPVLDGVLLANSLHFIPSEEQGAVLGQVITHIRKGGRLVVVDYNGRGANPWVPYPVSSRRLSQLLIGLGHATPTLVGTHPSLYGGELYAALATID